ncbi:MAG: hypothetical protein NWF09_05175 [Candidatus Bathyarchaeota archaeon]|nr:hypothetical protein [Candidatus Bathyarchaeota archaeon]
MKSWKILVAAVITVAAAALLTVSVFAYVNGQNAYHLYGTYANGAYPYGMMGGMMWNTYGYQQYPNQPNTPAPYAYRGGCHRGLGWNTYVTPPTQSGGATSAPIPIDTAVTIAQQYLLQLNNPDLAVKEVEEYTLNFYVQYYERSTGVGAFEMLIDKYSGRIYPEMGPNMMWNTKYGMHSGMMGWFIGSPTAPMTITAQQAKAIAQQYLDSYYLGTTAEKAEAFYGYYHITVLSGGKVYGMLSVNGYTGQIWYHTWHGSFIQEVELS